MEIKLKIYGLKISQFTPYEGYFVKTYIAPEEAISYHKGSEELGLILDPEFIILDDEFTEGYEYLIKLKIESNSSTSTSSNTWNNDIEAFEQLGFHIKNEESVEDNDEQTNEETDS